MRYSVDRMYENIAVCQDIETGEIIELEKVLLDKGVKEGDIIFLQGGIYVRDILLEAKRRKSLRERMDRLIKNKKKDTGEN